MDKVIRTLGISWFVLALVVIVLAAQPAAADTNTGTGPQTLRDRVAHQRKLCSDLGGSFSVNIQASQATATTTCTEASGTTTTCTHGTSSSSCKTTAPAEASAGTRPARSVNDVSTIDAGITQTDPQWFPAGNAFPATGAQLAANEPADSGEPAPEAVEAEPAAGQPVEAPPIEAVEPEVGDT